jgi:HrpA-like RNA helicase
MPSELPIDKHLPEIMKLLKAHQILVCVAGTGAGKSTRVPQAAAKHYKKVTVTQPRRVPCISISKRIFSETGTALGSHAGWRLKNDNNWSNDTQITFTVDQSLVNQIVRDRRLPSGLIMVDEVHERSLSIDLLLALIKKYLKEDTKIIICSATLDADVFSNYFGNDKVKVYDARNDPRYTVKEILNYDLRHGEHHTDGAIRIAKEINDKWARKKLLDGNNEIVTQGAILI